MWSELEQVFKELGLEYNHQGGYASYDVCPPSFFTYWNYDVPEEGFYDDEAGRAVWYWQVWYYTREPATLYSKMDEFSQVAKKWGFITEGKGEDAKTDDPRYSGRTLRLKYVESYA